MSLPQEIHPGHQDIQDTIARADDAQWVELAPGMSWMRILWTGSESGAWAVIFRWKKGHIVAPHKHLSASHTYVLSGKIKVRDGIFSAGDYVYEANGVLHGATEALEDTDYLFICQGPILEFDEDKFTQYMGWEEVEKLRARAAPTPELASLAARQLERVLTQ